MQPLEIEEGLTTYPVKVEGCVFGSHWRLGRGLGNARQETVLRGYLSGKRQLTHERYRA